MKKVFIDNFCGQEVLTIIWRGKSCWFANRVAEILEYDDSSKAITYCLKVEEFDVGIDYDILSGDDLKEFKSILKESNINNLKYASKIIIFYEDGLFGFLQFSHKPIGAKFRKWIRKEVKPKIIKKIGDGKSSISLCSDGENESIGNNLNVAYGKYIEVDKLNSNYNSSDFDVDKFQRLRLANESAKLLKELLDDVDTDSICKLAVIKTLFSEAGIELPIYFNKE